jgi:hypothetical protein
MINIKSKLLVFEVSEVKFKKLKFYNTTKYFFLEKIFYYSNIPNNIYILRTIIFFC